MSTLLVLGFMVLVTCSQGAFAQQPAQQPEAPPAKPVQKPVTNEKSPNYPMPPTVELWSTDGDNIYNTNAENVGVGTYTPEVKLDIMSTINRIARFSTTAADHSEVLIDAVSGYNANLTLQHAGVSKWFLGNRAANNRFSFVNATGTTEILSILQTGAVGIGTTNPLFSLDVNGGTNGFRAKAATSSSSDAIATFENSGGIQAIVRGNGYVGVGTASPGFKFDVQGGQINASGGFCIAGICKYSWPEIGGAQWNSAIGGIIYYNQGNVGIGGTTAGYRLDVQNGQINSSGGLCIAGICKSSWSEVGGGSSQWSNSSSNIFFNTGSVGIGTSTPDQFAKLHLSSTGGFGQDIQTTTNDWVRLRFVAPGRTMGFFLDGGYSGGIGAGKFGLYDYTASAWRMVTDPSGNVGFGTTAPGGPFEVRRDQNTPTNLYINNATAGSGTGAGTGIRFYENATLNAHIFTANSGSSGYTGGAGALQFWNFQNSPILFGTSGVERVRFDAAGNVGVGTATPNKSSASKAITVNGSSTAIYELAIGDVRKGNMYHDGTILSLYNNANGALTLGTNSAERLRIDAAGNVGIGGPPTTNRLEVVGNLNATGTITGGTIEARYQDVAEWVESSQLLPAGTVVVLDQTRSNQVVASSTAYDTRVAGVVSARPGITLGEKGETKVLVATTGRVKVRVDASAGPIRIGDLLVTSDQSGIAKKSEPLNLGGVQIHRPGTLIGKALEPLEKGTGEILVLLSLQ